MARSRAGPLGGRVRRSLWALLIFVAASGHAEVDDLDQFRPVELEDTRPLEFRKAEWQMGAAFARRREGPDRYDFPVEVSWGAAPNLELSLQSVWTAPPHEAEEPRRAGDLSATL